MPRPGISLRAFGFATYNITTSCERKPHDEKREGAQTPEEWTRATKLNSNSAPRPIYA